MKDFSAYFTPLASTPSQEVKNVLMCLSFVRFLKMYGKREIHWNRGTYLKHPQDTKNTSIFCALYFIKVYIAFVLFFIIKSMIIMPKSIYIVQSNPIPGGADLHHPIYFLPHCQGETKHTLKSLWQLFIHIWRILAKFLGFR